MEEITNMPHLDENKNSSTLDNHILENVELPVSPLMSGGENITPELNFQSPTSLQGNISEVNIQTPKNLNELSSETEGGVSKLEMASLHDISNGSILEENVSAYKSCNGSFVGDANNSFKSLNGSYVIEMTSPSKCVKSLLDDTLMKIKSPSKQPNANASLHETERNVSHGLSLNDEGSELLVKDASFTQDNSDSSVQNVEATIELPSPISVEIIHESAEVALNNTSPLLSNQSACFSESNLSNDAPFPDQENKDDLPKVLNDSNLDETPLPDQENKDDLPKVLNDSNLDEIPLPDQENKNDLPKVLNDSSLDGVLGAFFALKLEDTAASLSQSSDATFENTEEVYDPSNLMDFSVMNQNVLEEKNCKVDIQIDSLSAFDNVNKSADSPQTFSQIDEPSGDVVPEAFDGALRDDPFDMKSLNFNSCPTDDFIFKVPENPVDVENEEFADAVQFFKDPSSFSFLENIKTSPPMEGNAPRSSLYIKFDPLHSSFPRNPKSSDVLHALKNEAGLEPNVQCLNLSARESLGNILISFDSPRKSGSEDPKTPVMVAPAKLYTEEELQQHLNVNELTNQEMLLKKQREMEEEMARKEQEMMAKAGEKDAVIAKLEKLLKVQNVMLEEFMCISGTVSDNCKSISKKAGVLEEENAKLKGDVKTLTEDLQSVETTFADFHKRYEQCKGMLKSLKDNEEVLKAKLKELEQENKELQDSTQEALEKASSEASCIKKTSEARTAVLKAQLKKAELKISSLESDIKQIKIENSQLGGMMDDLMEKVGKS